MRNKVKKKKKKTWNALHILTTLIGSDPLFFYLKINDNF